MIDYVIKDMIAVSRYLPTGILLGLPIGVAYYFFKKRGHQGPKIASILFGVYFGILLVITFFSRELGSAGETIDLKLFSTWEINTRNRAFLIENILLFVPYGFLYCTAFHKKRPLLHTFLLGFVTSLGIETLQLVTKRGIFQLDDIVTNVIGAVLGALMFIVLQLCRKKTKE